MSTEQQAVQKTRAALAAVVQRVLDLNAALGPLKRELDELVELLRFHTPADKGVGNEHEG